MIKGNIEIKDLQTGKVYRQPMRSFVYNFLAGLYYTWVQTAPDPVRKDVDNVTDNCELGAVDALANDNTHGVVIGNGTSLESCDQYALSSKLDLTEEICNVGNVYLDGQIAKLDISRTFTNDTVSNETIYEIGLIDCYGADYFLGIRDIMSSAVEINIGVSKNVKFILSVTDGLTKIFLQYIESAFIGGNVTFKDTGNVSRTTTISDALINAAENIKTYGIVIGTSSTALDIEDYKLGTQLTTDWKHYVTQGYLTERETGTGISKVGFSREFKNDTGSSVVVEEVGIIGLASANNFLLARYLTGGITVASGETLLIRVKLKTEM